MLVSLFNFSLASIHKSSVQRRCLSIVWVFLCHCCYCTVCRCCCWGLWYCTKSQRTLDFALFRLLFWADEFRALAHFTIQSIFKSISLRFSCWLWNAFSIYLFFFFVSFLFLYSVKLSPKTISNITHTKWLFCLYYYFFCIISFILIHVKNNEIQSTITKYLTKGLSNTCNVDICVLIEISCCVFLCWSTESKNL